MTRPWQLALIALTALNSCAVIGLATAFYLVNEQTQQRISLRVSSYELNRSVSDLDHRINQLDMKAPEPATAPQLHPQTIDRDAREMAREAHRAADRAYAKALEPCTIHGIC